ncbi:MAG: hypothetical protein ACXW6R_27465, partial [Candidatus Binatia bacterium]
NTNMFVKTCGFNIPGVEDFRIRKFLSPRRKVAKFGKETIGLLRTVFTLLFSYLCELSAFARDIPSFDCGCSPTGEPLSPAKSGEKRVLLSVIVCAACANFSMRQRQEGGLQTRPYNCRFFFASFALFAAILPFGCGFAALGSSW